jgi:5'-nucleotidase
MRPLILCTNDDGYDSVGLTQIADALSALADVVILAPETEQSATSHSLTIHRPLRIRKVREAHYALDGTPADCVYIALHLPFEHNPVLPRRPDLVVSGVNRGLNLGQDVFYSGTIAAAREGALRGIASIAVSCDISFELKAKPTRPLIAGVKIVDAGEESGVRTWSEAEVAAAKTAESVPETEPDYVMSFDPQFAVRLAVRCVEQMLSGKHPHRLLNLNVPAGAVKTVVPTRLGSRRWEESVEPRVDPRGRSYYWIGGKSIENDLTEGTDTWAYEKKCASLSAINLEASHEISANLRAFVASLGEPR